MNLNNTFNINDCSVTGVKIDDAKATVIDTHAAVKKWEELQKATHIAKVDNTVYGPPLKWSDQSIIASDKINNTGWTSITSTIKVNDDTVLEFSNGESMTGARLQRLLKALENIIAKDYPEELL